MKVLLRSIAAVLLLSVCLTGCSKDSGQSASELLRKASEHLQSGELAEAEENAQKALHQVEEKYSMLHPELVKPLHVLGMTYQQQGKFFDAEQAYARAISILQSSGDGNNIAVSQLMNNLAGSYYAQEKYEQALNTFQQSLAVAESHYSEDDPRIQKIKKNIDICRLEVAGGEPSNPEAAFGQRFGKAGKKFAPQGRGGRNQGGTDQGTDMVAYDPPKPEEPRDILPDKVKQAVIKKLAMQNIHLDDLRPMAPVKIDSQGAVIPYRCTQKTTEADAGGIEAVLLFATVYNQETGGFVFKRCRMVSYDSYMEELKSGKQASLMQALKEVFPKVYS